MIVAGAITLDREAIAAILAILAIAALVDLLVMWGLVRWGAAIGHLLARHPDPWSQSKVVVGASVLAAAMSPVVLRQIAVGVGPSLALQVTVAVASGMAVGYLSPPKVTDRSEDDDPGLH